jgi:PPK2 family polyphosphate:nucleotide phosphotransferase
MTERHVKVSTDRFRIRPDRRLHLRRFDPAETSPFGSKAEALDRMAEDLDRLSTLQELLYAENRFAALVVLQGMDASGKDSAVKHVMSGMNPQGTNVVSFKAPSTEELDHNFLWRIGRALPARGHIGVFNRSHYEEVLVARVHPEIFDRERLPADLVTKNIWHERFEDIRAFERHLTRNGTVVRKFFLHASKDEQRQRFLKRLDDPAKNWKFSLADVRERDRWNDYMRAYEDMLAATSTDDAPWYVVPADHKWFAHLLIAQVIVETLQSLDLAWPKPTPAQQRELAAARRQLGGKRR